MRADLRERAQVLLHRAQALRAGVADPEVARVLVLVGDREHALDDDGALVGARQRARDEVDALDGDRVALLERPRDHRLDADEHVARLLLEAEQRGVGLLALVDPHGRARLEARVVDRRHELLREERAHRLADRVGRGDARDAEPVRDLGRDRRLAGPGGAADEEHDRQVELAERLEAPEQEDRVLALVLGEHGRRRRRRAARRRRPRLRGRAPARPRSGAPARRRARAGCPSP